MNHTKAITSGLQRMGRHDIGNVFMSAIRAAGFADEFSSYRNDRPATRKLMDGALMSVLMIEGGGDIVKVRHADHGYRYIEPIPNTDLQLWITVRFDHRMFDAYVVDVDVVDAASVHVISTPLYDFTHPAYVFSTVYETTSPKTRSRFGINAGVKAIRNYIHNLIP